MIDQDRLLEFFLRGLKRLHISVDRLIIQNDSQNFTIIS